MPFSAGEQTIDPNWTLISSPGVYPTPRPTYIVNTNGFPFNMWAVDYGTAARWIAPQPSYTNWQADTPGSYVYQTRFFVPTNVDPTTTLISGVMSSDNCTTDLMVNGHTTGFNMQSLMPGQPCIKTHYYFQIKGENAAFTSADGHTTFFATAVFLPGWNTLSFRVENYAPANGDNRQNPSGLIVNLHGTYVIPGPSVPEPATVGLGAAALAGFVLYRRRRHA